ncbi:recombination mediator RecR [candidate division KSB1 bacterium]
MENSPDSLEILIKALSGLPGIGRKSAQRLSYHILKKSSEEAEALADAIVKARKNIHFCTQCFNFAEEELCRICRDTRREKSSICVVEKASDIPILEKPGKYHGMYHVLGDLLSPLNRIGPDDIRIKELLRRIDGDLEEVILALNPSVEGEATMLYITRLVKPLDKKVSRLAQGLPAGSELEFADELTLLRALEGRIELQ